MYKIIYILSIITLYHPNLFGQVVTITPECLNATTGQIALEFDPSLQTDYPFPYNAECENITTGEFETFTINSLSHIIENLPKGNYEINVFLDVQCELYLDTYIGLDISSITPICICEYGGAEYEVTGGSGDYTYFWELTGEQFVITHNEPYPKFMGYELITELPDTYKLTVTDGNGCQATASMTIDTCSGLKLAALRERIKISPYIVLGSGPTGA